MSHLIDSSKSDLFEMGKAHIARWCDLNSVEPPRVNARIGSPDFGVCAYYRDNEIEIYWNDGRVSPSCAEHGLRALDKDARALVDRVARPMSEEEWATTG